MPQDSFRVRLKKLRKKHRLTQTQMGGLFGVGLQMYQKLEYGTYEHGKAKLDDYKELLSKYEKESDISKYLTEPIIPEKSGTNHDQITSLTTQLTTTIMENTSLKRQIAVQTNMLEHLQNELTTTKAQLEEERRKKTRF